MRQYLDFIKYIRDNGVKKTDRTGVGTLSIFGYDMRFDLTNDFPLLTTKKVHLKSIIHELLWFLNGETNTKYLNDHGVTIWNAWADANGNLGPVYGKQWRAWQTTDGRVIDQMSNLLNLIKTDPNSRRLIISAWNVGDLDKMALPPCHLLFQFYVANNKLSCKLTQRSADAFLGVPFNIASFSLLTHMIAAQCNLTAGEFIWSGGDCHIYTNHIDQIDLQLTREPYPLPQLLIKRQPESLFDYKFEDFEIINYQSHPHIKGNIAV